MTMTAPFGMFAWSGVFFFAIAVLVMFYKCSRYF
jgi:palmitoyltransferase